MERTHSIGTSAAEVHSLSRTGIAALLAACLCLPPRARAADTQLLEVPIIIGAPIQFFHLPSQSTRFVARKITQDDQGFLWLGAADGLRRYDGYSFMRFPEGDPDSLGFIISESLTKDRSGRIWFGVEDSLGRYDPATGNFRRYTSHVGNACGSVAPAHDISEDQNGLMWLATDDGITALDPVTSNTTCYQPLSSNEPTVGAKRVISILASPNGTLWIASDGGLDAFDWRTGKITRHFPLETKSGKRFRLTPFPATLFEDSSGVIWAGLSSGGDLVSLNPGSGQLTVYSFRGVGLPPNTSSGVVSIETDHDRALWLGTSRLGLVKLTPDRKQAVWYQSNPDDPNSLNGDLVMAVFRDREGSLWTMTKTGDVYRFDPRTPVFRSFRHEPGNPRSLDDNSVISAYEDDPETLWIGTERGLNRVNRRTDEVTRYEEQVFSTGVRSIARDRNGDVWLGTRGNGLVRFDPDSGRYKTYSYVASDPGTLSNNYVGGLLIDRHGTLWAATDFGLDRFDPKTEEFRKYAPKQSSLTQYHSIAEEPNGVLWLASSAKGLHRFDPATGELTVFENRAGDDRSLSHNRVFSVYIDRSGTIWAATFRGLDKFNPRDHTFTRYNLRSGGLADTALGILQDESGYLWISTPDGLSRFDPRTGAFAAYHHADGLPTDLFSVIVAATKSPNGEMFFGTYTGLLAFFPNQVMDHPFVPPVVLTNFRLSGEQVPTGKAPLKQPIWSASSLELPARSIFSFDFSALSYIDPARTQYRYRLEGLESHWNFTDSSRRVAAYTTLPAGHYTLDVQARTTRGDWTRSGITLRVRILPPWYRTWWLRSIAALALLATIWSLYRLRLNRIAQEFNVRLAERTRIARELHDNLLQTVQGFMLRLQAVNETIPPGAIKDELEETLEIGDRAIAEGRQAVQNLRSPAGTNDLAQVVGALGDELSTGNGVTFRLVVEGPMRELHPIIREEIYSIAREALRNAFTHACATRIEAGITFDQRLLQLRVRDNGKGIAPEITEQGRVGHYGIAGMQERARQIGSKLVIFSGPETGTEIELSVPGSMAYSNQQRRFPFTLFR